MSQFTVIGTVPNFRGSEFHLPIDNISAFRDWMASNGIETIVEKRHGRPAIKIRKKCAAKCRPGQKIRHLVERYDRGSRPCILAIDVEPF